MLCTFTGKLSVEIGFIAMTLAYGMVPLLLFIGYIEDIHLDHLTDTLAFSIIVYLVIRSNIRKVPIPSILKTIVQDATYYFLVIFTSHLMLVMFLAFANVSTLS